MWSHACACAGTQGLVGCREQPEAEVFLRPESVALSSFCHFCPSSGLAMGSSKAWGSGGLGRARACRAAQDPPNLALHQTLPAHLTLVGHFQPRLRRGLDGDHCLFLKGANRTDVLVSHIGQCRGQQSQGKSPGRDPPPLLSL